MRVVPDDVDVAVGAHGEHQVGRALPEHLVSQPVWPQPRVPGLRRQGLSSQLHPLSDTTGPASLHGLDAPMRAPAGYLRPNAAGGLRGRSANFRPDRRGVPAACHTGRALAAPDGNSWSLGSLSPALLPYRSGTTRMVRMGSPVRFRRGAPPQTSSSGRIQSPACCMTGGLQIAVCQRFASRSLSVVA